MMDLVIHLTSILDSMQLKKLVLNDTGMWVEGYGFHMEELNPDIHPKQGDRVRHLFK